MPADVALPTVGVVLLHMGDRPGPLAQALASLRSQQDVQLDVVLVGNGWKPTGLPDWVRSVHEPQNVGIPEGRNVGAAQLSTEYVFFFDDDATLSGPRVLADLVAILQNRPQAALCQPGLTDPVTGDAPRRWVPRLFVRSGIPQGGQVASFSEGVVLIRRSAFEQAGGWPGRFFFGHEGIEVAWRLTDLGWSLWYAPEVQVHHPYTDETRHTDHYRFNARNRVWVARRNLPAPLVPIYLGNWTGIMLLRAHDAQARKVWLRGFAEGWRTDPGLRRPISWRAVARLTRAGRPPVV